MENQKYTKKNRLRKRREYVLLSKYGKKYFSSYFIVIFNKNNLHRNRLGITVSKKVGNAKTRNKIKRIIKEYFRLKIKTKNIYQDINVIAKKKSNDLNKTKIFQNINKILKYIFFNK